MTEFSENDKKEIQNFLIRCLNPANTLDTSLCREWSDEQIDYLHLICKQKRIFPIIFNRLKHLPEIPERIIKPLHSTYRKNSIRNIRLFSELKKILTAFDQAGIKTIILKGSYLAPVVYGNVADRVLRDIDILVTLEDIQKTQQTMHSLGYEQEAGRENQFESRDEIEYFFSRHKDLLPYIKNGLHVEVHQKINYPWGPQIDVDALWKRMQSITVLNQTAYILHPEDFILHLCLHLTHQDKFTNGLLALYDIKLFYNHHKDMIDFKNLLQKAKKYKMERSLFVTLQLCKVILGESFNTNIICQMDKEVPNEIIKLSIEQLFTDKAGDCYIEFNGGNLRNKIKKVFSSMFISNKELSMRYGKQESLLTSPYLYFKHWKYLITTHALPILRYSKKENVDHKIIAKQSSLINWLSDK